MLKERGVALTAAEIALCNRALNRLGADTFASGDGSGEETQCEAHYEATRDALLRSTAWRFACRWSDLVQDEEDDSGTATDATATTLEDTDQSWTEDEYADYYVYISGGKGSGQVRAITSNTADTLTVPTWGTTPDDTSTYEIWENVPPYPWDYQYDLPDDFLRYVKSDPLHDRFEISGSLLRSDEDSAVIQYVRQETTTTLFDPLFIEALVAALAATICMPLVHDKALYDDLVAEAELQLAEARRANRMDAKTEPKRRTWLAARR